MRKTAIPCSVVEVEVSDLKKLCLFSYKIYNLQYPSNGTWLKYGLLQGNTYGLISSVSS